MLLFLLTNWPHEELDQVESGSLTYWIDVILLVEQRGVEPLTSALRTRRSAKLSYCPTRLSMILGSVEKGVKLVDSGCPSLSIGCVFMTPQNAAGLVWIRHKHTENSENAKRSSKKNQNPDNRQISNSTH